MLDNYLYLDIYYLYIDSLASENTTMGRLKGSTNKIKNTRITLDERLKMLASLIVDRIIEDQLNGTLRFRSQYKK